MHSTNELSTIRAWQHVATSSAVTIVAASMSVRRDVCALIQMLPTLSGIAHAAGVGSKSLLGSVDALGLHLAFAPKALGASFIKSTIKCLHLEMNVNFSSVSAAFGYTGQAGYGAANGAMDARGCASE